MEPTVAWQELEQRVRRLEETLARQPMPIEEEAVVQKVLSRLKALAVERRQEARADENGLVLAAPTTAVATLPPEPPPDGAVIPVIAVAPDNTDSERGDAVSTDSPHRLWSWLQALADLRLLLAMYFDPNYRISRLTHFGLLALFGWLVFDYFFFAVWFAVPIVSPLFERLFIVIATLIAYKLLKMELVRYRRVRAYMNRWYRR